MGEAIGIGGAARPAQQGDLLRRHQVLAFAVHGAGQHLRQAGNTLGVTKGLAHAEIADLGDSLQCTVQ